MNSQKKCKGQAMEPALCQLYRHTFVPDSMKSRGENHARQTETTTRDDRLFPASDRCAQARAVYTTDDWRGARAAGVADRVLMKFYARGASAP